MMKKYAILYERCSDILDNYNNRLIDIDIIDNRHHFPRMSMRILHREGLRWDIYKEHLLEDGAEVFEGEYTHIDRDGDEWIYGFSETFRNKRNKESGIDFALAEISKYSNQLLTYF